MTDTTDRTRRAVLTVTVRSRPDGGHYFDQDDFFAHIVGWLKAGLKNQHAIAEVTIAGAAPAAAPVVPSTDRAAVVCICEHTEPQHFEDACLVCSCGDYLPPTAAREVIARLQEAVKRKPADRGVILREAATRYEAILANANTGQDPRYWTAVRDITLGLRRVADEAQPFEADRDHSTSPKADSKTQPTTKPTAYSDGKGRVFCVACPCPAGVTVPLTVEDVDHWELCPSCGRHVIDVARTTTPAVVSEPGKET